MSFSVRGGEFQVTSCPQHHVLAARSVRMVITAHTSQEISVRCTEAYQLEQTKLARVAYAAAVTYDVRLPGGWQQPKAGELAAGRYAESIPDSVGRPRRVSCRTLLGQCTCICIGPIRSLKYPEVLQSRP